MEYLILLVMIQIIFESLPVSSSGHLNLFALWLARIQQLHKLPVLPPSFYFFLHGPTVGIILYYLWRERKAVYNWWCTYKDSINQIIVWGAIVQLETAGFYFLFKQFNTDLFPVSVGFMMTALALLSVQYTRSRADAPMGIGSAIIVGTVQGISLLPGISRLGAVYSCMRWLGFDLKRSFWISMLIHLPLIMAGFLKGCWNLVHMPWLGQLLTPYVICGVIVATVVGYQLFVWVVSLARRDRLWWFGWYAFIPALIWCILI